jgi:BirA family biotin operon repressor/biotin-[acetyl-CoA-carboxylase] ligase
LNLALAVTVVRVLYRLGTIDVGLKWLNDILWKGRKLAGLLLESRCEKTSCEIVIGIGINVKMPTININSILQPWVDLHTILDQPISRNVLAAMLIDHCLQTLIIYPQEGLASFLPDWHRFDLSYGQRVTLEIPSKTFNNSTKEVGKTLGNEFKIQVNKQWITGTACGIDEQGALLLQVGNHCQRYVYGEVRLHL